MKTVFKKLTTILTSTVVLLGLASFVAAPVFAQASPTTTPPAAAASPVGGKAAACDGIKAAGGDCGTPAQSNDLLKTIITAVINVLTVVVGAICVVMVIIGGFRYVVSGGDSNGIQGAKNTILYAL